ncbi:MAG TPA: SRPBCC family protein [Urbifossiella sp.]|nr:SRPBCC family protein [Urbifossiella sp.]
MPGFDLTHTVAAPLPAVFAAFTDFENAPKRIPDIIRVEMLTPGPVGVGTAFKETRKMFGKECTETMTVTAFEPGKLVELSAAACGMEFSTRFTFAADGGKTRVDVAVRKRAVTLVAKLFTPLSFLMSGMMKKCIARDVASVGAAVEAGPAA